MAAGEYMKAAVSNMYRAADALKQQAKEMQAHLTNLTSDKKSEIDRTTVELRARQAELVSVHDEGHRSRLAVEIAKLQQEIMAAERQIKEAQSDLQNAAAQKLSLSSDIEVQAKQIESQAGTVD